MAIIPVHTRREVPESLRRLLERRPVSWIDDGLTAFPDSILGWDISPAGSGHDVSYCTRMWPAGALDRRWREAADAELGRNVRALLPFGLRLIGYAVFLVVYQVGGMKAFNSCGPHPYGVTAGQSASGLCRHGCGKPDWMR